MQKRLLAAALGAALLANSAAVFAEEEASPHTLTANVGLFSQYIFRGLTQTNEDPAIQGGFDYSHASGFYAGVWASNISWLRDAAPPQTYRSGGSAEIDFYGGFKTTVAEDFTLDVGVLQYWYPGDEANGTPKAVKADTTEIYGAVGWKWFTVKYSSVVSNKAFGVKDADGTGYWDFSVAYPLADTGLTFGAHYGIQEYRGRDNRSWTTAGGRPASNDSLFSYDDWRLSVAYDLGKLGGKMAGSEVGLMYTDTNSAHTCAYGKLSDTDTIGGGACTGAYPKNIAKDQVTVWFKKTF